MSAACIGVLPSSRWRLTFSTTIMASSTTRPMASTSASRVRILMVKPHISMKVKVPIRDSGIATTGISTERGEPRKTKTTRVRIRTEEQCSNSTSSIELLMYLEAS